MVFALAKFRADLAKNFSPLGQVSEGATENCRKAERSLDSESRDNYAIGRPTGLKYKWRPVSGWVLQLGDLTRLPQLDLNFARFTVFSAHKCLIGHSSKA
jgi:hypothetical protein